MQRLFLMIIPALICGLVFTCCGSKVATNDNTKTEKMSKKASIPIMEGKYSGTFTVKYFVEMPSTWGTGSGKTTIELKNGKFTCTGNPNRVPAGGSGSYSISDGKIKFEDENFWSADFDWGLILSGKYDYTFDGKKLKISAKYENAHYEYDLERQ